MDIGVIRGIDGRFVVGFGFIGTLILMFLLGLTPGIGFTEDLGRHLLLGQIIFESGRIPSTNYLTYTHGDFPFINHHWLFEVQIYLLHKWIGYNGLIIVKAIVGAMTIGLAMTAIKPSRYYILWWITAMCAAILLSSRSHIRPEMITFLCIGLFLWLFEKLRTGKNWPRLVCVILICYWANSHIYFIFGIGMLGAFMLERIWDNTESLILELSWFGLMIAACCVNPNGFLGLIYPFYIFENYGVNIAENLSVLYWWSTMINPGIVVMPVISSIIILAMYKLWIPFFRSSTLRPRLANTIILFASFIASWMMIRNIPLIGLAALPVVSELYDHGTSTTDKKCNRKSNLVLIGIAIIINILLAKTVTDGTYSRKFSAPIKPTPFGLDDPAYYQKIAQLVDEEGLTGPVFTNFDIGSFVEYQIWPQRGYVDNRPEAYPNEFWSDEYRPAFKMGGVWKDLIEQRKINAIIISFTGVNVSFYLSLMRDPEWVLIHLDSMLGVWLKNNIQNKVIIDRNKFDNKRIDLYNKEISDSIDHAFNLPWWRRQVELYRLIYSLNGLYNIGEKSRLWPHLKKIYERYPDLQLIHQMIRLSAPPYASGLLAEMLEKQSKWPFSIYQVVDWARHLNSQGKMEEAIFVLERGKLFFPLSLFLDDEIIRVESKSD